MDYEKKYKSLVEAVKTLKETNLSDEGIQNWVNDNVPELKESEDERIRKAIKKALQVRCDGSRIISDEPVTLEEAIAWLENQGNTNETINRDEFAQGVLRGAATNLITWIDYNAAEGNMCLSNLECEDLEDAVVDLDWSRVYDYMKKKLEKQGNKPQGKSAIEAAKEEKVDNRNCVKPTNKVKPKFHEGDWIILSLVGEKDKLVQVQTIEYFPSGQPRYVTTEGKWYGTGVNARLWTIQDAKDGDVLCYKDEISLYKHDIKNCTKQETTFGGFVYHCCYDGKGFVVDSLYSLTEQDKMDILPATKEQRDLLFQKMKEAGYMWDTEKKKLKKIDKENLTEFEIAVKNVMEEAIEAGDTHNLKADAENLLRIAQPTWSEEDEEMLTDTEYLMRVVKMENRSDNEYQRAEKCINWLKSFRPRNNK